MAGLALTAQTVRAYQRWNARLVLDMDTGCEEPDRGVGRAGVRIGDGVQPLYRLIYAGRVGPVPPGARLMRTCGNKRCVSDRHRMFEPAIEVGQ